MVTVLGLTVSTLAHQLRLQRKAMEAVLTSQTLLETMVIEEKSVFAATAMHDLQSPLHGIRNLLEFARARPERLSGSDREHLLADMQASVDRMLSMVATTLAPMKAERAEAFDSVAPCDVSALARRVAEAEAPLAGSKGIALRLAIPTEPAVVIAESIAVEHILGNFLSNAVKFSAPGATIVISVEETAGSICLSVEDEGPGIPEEDRRRSFREKSGPMPRVRPPVNPRPASDCISLAGSPNAWAPVFRVRPVATAAATSGCVCRRSEFLRALGNLPREGSGRLADADGPHDGPGSSSMKIPSAVHRLPGTLTQIPDEVRARGGAGGRRLGDEADGNGALKEIRVAAALRESNTILERARGRAHRATP